MGWCKTDVSDFFLKNFFPSNVPEFLHVVFNVKEKHGPVLLSLVFACFRVKSFAKTLAFLGQVFRSLIIG